MLLSKKLIKKEVHYFKNNGLKKRAVLMCYFTLKALSPGKKDVLPKASSIRNN